MSGFMIALCFVTLTTALGLAPASLANEPNSEVIRLWPSGAPDTPKEWTEPEYQGKESITFVSTPTLTVVRPSAGKANGTAMIVAPGGAFAGLAWRLEGVEIAEWLAGRGITAFILKYRVRPRQGGAPLPAIRPGVDPMEQFKPAVDLAMADGMQAVRLVRQEAARFGIKPNRVGFIGFSAGAMTAMNVILKGDAQSRPDFAAPIYGAMPDRPVPAGSPPLFVVVATDDKIMFGRSIEIFNRWIASGNRAELHVYEKGGHGFGMRRKGLPVDLWPQAFEAWLKDKVLLQK